jgi:hypothetical protein
MAKTTVRRAQPEKPPILSITLELTQEEAQWLHDLTSVVCTKGWDTPNMRVFKVLHQIEELVKAAPVHKFNRTFVEV